MDLEKVSLLSNLKFSSFEKINENFLKAKCYVMALGKNVNKSYFDKENVDKAFHTLAYVPVIGHLMVDDNGVYHLGGHDYKIDLNDFKLKSQCVPFGVALPTESPTYEEVKNDDGTTSTYLTCEVILWIGRYPELADAFYDENIFTGQSMEIFYSKYEPLKDDPTYTNIIDFSFDALCMLQKSDDDKFNVDPCFPKASIVPITYSIDKQEFSSLMNELKEELNGFFNKNNSEKGGNVLDKKLEILQKFNKTVEDLDFSIEDMSVEDLNAKMEELYGEQKVEPVAFSATYRQKRDALNNALDPIVVKDDEGNYLEETYFWVEDFDDEYVYVEKSYWAPDNYECTYGRFTYTFDEATLTATITSEFEEMVKMWLTLEEKEKIEKERLEYETKYSTLEQEFSDYKAEHSFLDSDFNALKEYKENKEVEERQNAENELFADYEEKIGETEEFKALKENSAEYSLDALKKECLCIVGMYSMSADDGTAKPKKDSLKFSVEKPETDDEPYGGVIKKYLKR